MKLSQLVTKHPTIDKDFIAYTSGANNTFDSTFSDYVREVETVERAIRVIANIASLCKMKIYKETASGDLKPAKVKNIDLTYPNELDTYIDFNRKIISSVFSQGASIIIGETNKGIVNFYPYSPESFKIESDGSKLISEFIYTSEDGQETSYSPDDIIYINDSIDPSNLLYTLSRLRALNDVVTMQASIVAKTKEYTSGGAKDSVIVSGTNPLGEKQQKAIKTAFDTFVKSTSSTTLFINTDLKVDKITNQMTGNEMLEFFKALNQMILDQFNLPPALLGDYSASGANKNEELLFSLRGWFTTVLKPVLENIGLQFTKYFVNNLGLKNIVVKLDYKDVDILDDFIDQKVDRAIKLHKSGIMSLNEARELSELPRIEEDAADLHYLPQFLTGSEPISYENFDKDLQRYIENNSNSGNAITDAQGNSGEEDNTNIVDDTRGGAQGQ